jgi:tryptophanyl-tRNA synthetase
MSSTLTTPSQFAAAERSAQLERAIRAAPEHFRVLTGDRPTGPLHLCHLFGTLANRVRLQDLGVEMLVLVADYQTLTDRDAPATLPCDVIDQVADYLAVGIDPDRSTIFAHSQISALNQLLVPFLSLVSVTEVSRNPTVKEEFAVSRSDSMTALTFTYPVHQAADILFCHANLVPVGRDQLAHLELTRTIARRFNDRYATDEPYFPEPDALLGAAPLLLGMDGAKMSKSRGNAIALAASADDTARLIRGAKTDAERRITYDREGRPEVSNLLLLAGLGLETDPEDLAEQIGDAGAAGLKRLVTDAVNERLKAMRTRRRELVEDHAYLRRVLADGAERASSIAEATLTDVRRLMYNSY